MEVDADSDQPGVGARRCASTCGWKRGQRLRPTSPHVEHDVAYVHLLLVVWVVVGRRWGWVSLYVIIRRRGRRPPPGAWGRGRNNDLGVAVPRPPAHAAGWGQPVADEVPPRWPAINAASMRQLVVAARRSGTAGHRAARSAPPGRPRRRRWRPSPGLTPLGGERGCAWISSRSAFTHRRVTRAPGGHGPDDASDDEKVKRFVPRRPASRSRATGTGVRGRSCRTGSPPRRRRRRRRGLRRRRPRRPRRARSAMFVSMDPWAVEKNAAKAAGPHGDGECRASGH